MSYLYILENGEPSATSSQRIDPPDTNHPDYVDGNLSQYWDPSWVTRLDTNIVGQPSAGQTWDFNTNSWFISKTALKQSVRNYRANLESNSIVSYMAFDISVNVHDSRLISLVSKARLENPEDVTTVVYDINKNAVSMTNAEFIGLVDKILNHFQSMADAEIQLIAQIEMETLTSTIEIDAAFIIAMTNPLQHLNPIIDLYGMLNGKQDKIKASPHIEDVAFIETDYDALHGLGDVISALVLTNKAHNDLVGKFNALLTFLTTQGMLQNSE